MRDFLLHLRLHYQIGILSGGYLLGGVLTDSPQWDTFWLQFLNVHILLFGGATAFNSWWDKDEGPVGGLRNPPAMRRWMRDTSLLMQAAGLILAAWFHLGFAVIYAASFFLFWAYSSPVLRWKGHPVLSLWVIAVSTGVNSLLMGAMAAGTSLDTRVWIAAAGTGLVIVSLYPLSQIYQLEADAKRNDRTFALQYGTAGVKHFFRICFPAGVLLISFALGATESPIALAFAGTGLAVWMLLVLWMKNLQGAEMEYYRVMRIKFLTSAAFVSFLAIILTGKAIGWFH